MNILQTILSILQIISALIIIFLVLLQSDNESGSLITGEGNSNMGMSKDKKIARMTVWVGTFFVILTIASSSIMMFNIN